MNTWTLIAIARSSWGAPVTLETVEGVKTNKKQEVADSLYVKYPNCSEVSIRKEEKK